MRMIATKTMIPTKSMTVVLISKKMEIGMILEVRLVFVPQKLIKGESLGLGLGKRLKAIDTIVINIRESIKYIKGSQARKENSFHEILAFEKIQQDQAIMSFS
ncbi:hypothetical protein E2562_003628 [Oryza meyeriana var. granulata]|uniref:Uncharacterized protein n=1 Tax=Oryza meyeriana var. granulata TaxID=110450 RepID=A0A6G1CNF1_9ORYZ|nr:hypothetical protein E2562_003628 [Oryza meyeriana var. granulata]